jgi:prephenate dehydratase
VTERRIGFLGPAGTFTEQALLTQQDLRRGQLVELPTIADVLAAASTGEVDLGFVAIENAIEGAVNVTLDSLAFDTDLLIQREVVLDIELCLMARRGTTVEQVSVVLSHPMASAQCRQFVRKELGHAPVRAANSTVDAARLAAEQPGTAAIGPPLAAERYGLEVLVRNIADHPDNQTRFVLVAADGIPERTGHDKTSVVLFQRQDRPGSLLAILQEFAARDINLTKLTSRPAKTTLGQYCFMVDLEGHIADDLVADALRSIRAKHAEVKYLGSYPAAGAQAPELRRAADSAWAEADTWIKALRSRIG